MDIIIVEEIEVYLNDPEKSFTEHRMIYSGSEPYIIQKHKNYIQLIVNDVVTNHYGKLVVRNVLGNELYQYETDCSSKPQLASIEFTTHRHAVEFFRKGLNLYMSILTPNDIKRYLVADVKELSFIVEDEIGLKAIVKAIHDESKWASASINRVVLKPLTRPKRSEVGGCSFTELMFASNPIFDTEEVGASIDEIMVRHVEGMGYVTYNADTIHEFKGRFIELRGLSDFL